MYFDTPLRQISGIADPIRDSKDLMAVRTWDGVFFVSMDLDSENEKLELISTHRFDRPPMHVAFHPELYGEAILILDDGSLYMWDAERGERNMCVYFLFSLIY